MVAGRSARGLLAGLVLLACRPPLTPIARAPAPESPAPTSPPNARPQPPVSVAASPVDLMPDGTALVVSLASVRHGLRVVDLPALIAKFRPHYDTAAAYLEQRVGTNLLDPAKWPEIGVDPDGPLGGALFNTDAEAGCFFFTLSDPLRFREFVDRLGGAVGGGLVPRFEDRGLVLGDENDRGPTLVLRDKFAFVVTVGAPARAPFDYARQLASVDPARGLSATPRWQRAARDPSSTRDLFAYVDLSSMLAGELAALRARDEVQLQNWAESELQRMREQGASAEDIARMETTVAEQRAAEAQYKDRRRRSYEFWSSVFAPLGPLVFEFGVSEASVAGTIRADAPEDSALRAALLGSGPSLAVTAAAHRVLSGASLYIDIPAATALLDALLRVEGEDLDKLYAEIQGKLGVDLRVVLAGLDGSVSFAWTLDDPAALATEQRSTAYGFALVLGLKRPGELQTLLSAAAGKLPPPLRARPDLKARGVAITGTQWRDIYFSVSGSKLTVSTDRDLARRLAAPAKAADRVRPPSAGPVLAADAAGSIFLDYLLPFSLFLGRSTSDHRYDPSQNQPYWRFQDVPHAKIDAVPRSAAYKSKLKDWRELDAKVRTREEQGERAQAAMLRAIAESLGALAVNLREVPAGLRVEGGHYFGPGGLTRVVEQTVDLLANRSSDPTWELYERRSAVENELQDIRVRDVEVALGVRSASN